MGSSSKPHVTLILAVARTVRVDQSSNRLMPLEISSAYKSMVSECSRENTSPLSLEPASYRSWHAAMATGRRRFPSSTAANRICRAPTHIDNQNQKTKAPQASQKYLKNRGGLFQGRTRACRLSKEHCDCGGVHCAGQAQARLHGSHGGGKRLDIVEMSQGTIVHYARVKI